ncbi:MAG: NAD-dependent epimerase/dehydratase family protein [Candidatus Acidiferrales bacterium]
MRILVTGATGFVGSRLLERLAEMGGHDLYSMQRYVTGRYVLGADHGVKVVFCDLRDQFALKCAIRDVQPEVVFHLAAISPVSYSYDHPNEVLETNLMGTVNLAESCLREVPHFKHFLFASTSETFGNGPLPKREDTPQAPNSPYSVAKHAAEKYVLYMWDAYKFPVTVLRPFNTYGRRDNTHFLVERMLVQMLQGNTVKLGDPTPERDLLYIDDHVDSYLTCLAQPQASIGQAFNFSTGDKLTVQALADKMRAIAGFRGQILWDTIPKRPLDIRLLYGDSAKAKSVLGWEAKVSLDEGLRRTADFWRKKLAASSGATRATAS